MSSLTRLVSFDFLLIPVLLSQAAASVRNNFLASCWQQKTIITVHSITLHYEMKTANAECP
jgi:hypothetical protein